jgi:hypothetical protein
MANVAFLAVGALTWTGATLLLDAWWHRWDRPSLAERLGHYRTPSVADETQRWPDNTNDPT